MDTYSYDSDTPHQIKNTWHRKMATEQRDELRQMLHEAEEAYCKYAQSAHSAANEARYAHAKLNLTVLRGMLAESQEALNTYPSN